MLKLVFVDMDGTFVDSRKRITPENAAVLDLAAEKGVRFVPCTGRNVTGLPAELISHSCVSHAVCCNGALVCDVRTQEVLHEVAIDKETVWALYGKIGSLPITFDIFADGRVYTLADRWHYLDELDVNEATRANLKDVRTRFDGTLEELLATCGTVCRVNVFYLSEGVRQRVWDAVDADASLRRASSLPCNVEITDVRAHKGAGLLWLCDHLGVDPADTVAFGDSSNDVTMLEAAGDGVAMGNSLPVAFAAADHTTSSNDDSGVARYLQPILEGM